MKLRVYHRTAYAYANPVRESFNEARLQPISTREQICHDFQLNITPHATRSHYADFYGNNVHLFELPDPHQKLSVEAISTVTTTDKPNAPAPDATPAPLKDMPKCERVEGCYDFLQASTYVDVGPTAAKLANQFAAGPTDAWQATLALMRHVYNDFEYRPAATNVHTHAREVLKARKGVCQDFAHVMVSLCRALRIPARYVSGYIYNGPADKLKGAQATHAWVEAYIPGFGWCGLDPTNDCLADGRYVKIAFGRDYADVPPLKGTYRGTAERKMTVEVLVSLAEEKVSASA